MNDVTVFILREKEQTNTDQGIFGRLIIPNLYECFSLELPWRDNKQNVSCLPTGNYKLLWCKSPRFKRMMYLIIEDIPHRGGFRLHSGNLAGDTSKGYTTHSLGCPLLGRKRGILNDQKAVLISRPAVSDFENIMNGRSAKLIIAEV